MKRHIPNAITLCNLLSGCVATQMALQGRLSLSLLFIVIGAVFDFFDGFVARLLHETSAIGKELDSLADDITFGFAPAAIVYALLQTALCPWTCASTAVWVKWLPYTAFLIAAFSALRLAKFNLDERQTSSFIGLPTPANALFWAALGVGLEQSPLLQAPWMAFALTFGVVISCVLLVSPIPMFALKFKHLGWRGNELRICFIVCAAFLLLWLGLVGFSAVILLYVLCSVFHKR